MVMRRKIRHRGRSPVVSQIVVAAVLGLLLATVTVMPALAGFDPRQTINAGNIPVFASSADVNNDGKADLLVINDGDGTVGVLLGNDDGTFHAQTAYAVTAIPFSIAVADFNGDHTLDLALVNPGDGTVRLLPGNGDGTFQPQQTITVGAHTGLRCLGRPEPRRQG